MTIQNLIDRAHRETGADKAAIRHAIGQMLGMIRRRVSDIEFQDLLVNAPGALSLLADEMVRGNIPAVDNGNGRRGRAELFDAMEAIGLSRGRADLLGLLLIRVLHENGAEDVAWRVAKLLFSFDGSRGEHGRRASGLFSSTPPPANP